EYGLAARTNVVSRRRGAPADAPPLGDVDLGPGGQRLRRAPGGPVRFPESRTRFLRHLPSHLQPDPTRFLMTRYIYLSLFSLVAIFTAGCSGEESACGDGLVECGGAACVDVKSNRYHCGGCGIACAFGQECVEGVCVCPEGVDCEALVPDLFAACFQAGHVGSYYKEDLAWANASVMGIEGPQTMAALDEDHFVVVGTLDQVLRVVNRRNMQVVGQLTLG